MTIDAYESSPDSGEPILLFQITYGDGAYYAYTNAEETVTHEAVDYNPHPISMSELESKGRLDASEVTVDVPLNSPVAMLFRAYPPGRVVSIIVRQGHVIDGDTEFPICFVGRILESRRQGVKAVLVCELTGASMKRPGLRRHYQWSCPHVLFGPACQADQVAATTTSTVDSFTGNSVTLPAGWIPQIEADPEGAPGVFEDQYAGSDYVGGLVSWTGPNGPEQLTVLRVERKLDVSDNVIGDELVLAGPVRDLDIGDSVTVALGCPHDLGGCDRLHDNVLNYGGQPFIPVGTNPIGKNNHN